MSQRLALIGPGQQERAFQLLSRWRGQPMVVFLADAQAKTGDWAFLQEVAERLGPHVGLVPYSPDAVLHATWDAYKAPEGERLLVLHLQDARAASRLAAGGLELHEHAVLAEQCRWAPGPCPALDLRMLAFGGDGSLRSCPSSEDLSKGEPPRLSEIEKKRGCRDCLVRESCSKCLFCGRLSDTDFCDVRRRMGLEGREVQYSALTSGIAIGWDE
jgi:hypothetical protein